MFKMKPRTLFIALFVPFLLIQLSSAQCGRRRSSRIVNGVNTGVNEFTMMAGLIVVPNVFVFCGATILSNYYVLTAAHCVYQKSAGSIGVLAGDWDYKSGTDTPYAALYIVQSYLIHPSYRYNVLTNDIAIIRTQQSIAFNVAVGPVCLPPTNLLFAGSTVEAVGWGTTSFGGPASSILKKASLTVLSNSQCSNMQSNQMCAQGYGRDACQYDSGGPLYVMINGLVNLAGIIIGGEGCATNTPSVNTRVTSFIPWIRQYVPGV